MKGNGKGSVIAGIVAAMDTKHGEWISFRGAADKIADAFGLPPEAALMVLYGLCAAKRIRYQGDIGTGRVAADDLRGWLAGLAKVPLTNDRDRAIKARIDKGQRPPRNISWTEFCVGVRADCNVGPDRGWRFSEKQIKRRYKDLSGI